MLSACYSAVDLRFSDDEPPLFARQGLAKTTIEQVRILLVRSLLAHGQRSTFWYSIPAVH
jgi:hypothetical protein